MVRPFLSLLVAAAATSVGLALTLGTGSARAESAIRTADSGGTVLMVAGATLLAGAGASLAIHWVGTLFVGGVHLAIGGLAVLLPKAALRSSGFSPVFELTGMMRDIDHNLGDGATVFFFSGCGVLLGAFLVAASVGVRTRFLDPPAGRARVLAALVGGSALLIALALLVRIGDGYLRALFEQPYSVSPAPLMVGIAGMLAGIGGLLLRWSSLGAFVAGGSAALLGILALVLGPVLMPRANDSYVIGYGLTLIVGMSVLGAAVAAVVGGRSGSATDAVVS